MEILVEWQRARAYRKLVPKQELAACICSKLGIKTDLAPLTQADLQTLFEVSPAVVPSLKKLKKDNVVELQQAYPTVKSFSRLSADSVRQLIGAINAKNSTIN